MQSVFESWPEDLLQVIAVNDCSTDDSLSRIQAVAREHPLDIIDQPENTGKAKALNLAFERARHAHVLFLDADTLLNSKALEDMLSRMEHDSRVGGVSCPYSPINRGFLPSMQAIEYSMLRLGQGAGNVTSAMALWGGCLMVRRESFLSAGTFSVNAITEDVDLAFKLSLAGWRVEQSFVFIHTHVPEKLRTWMRQKVRWTAGGFQCIFAYPRVWLCNPLQMMFISAYTILTVTGIASIMSSEHSLLNISEDVATMAGSMPVGAVWDATLLSYGPILLTKCAAGIGFSLFSLMYVIPTISRSDSIARLLLFIPFSMGYFPIYLLVSLFGFTFWFVTLRQIGKKDRAW